jgi:replicative DNA helicase
MIENTILSSLIFNEEYTRKTLPYIKEEYFNETSDRLLFSIIDSFFKKYNKMPTKEVLSIELENYSVSQDVFEDCAVKVNSFEKSESALDWLVDNTEKFCQDRAIYNAVKEGIQILDNKSSKDKGALPQLLADALAVSFDQEIGHDYFEDFEARFRSYYETTSKIPFSIELLNKITCGGLDRKTLNIFLAGTGVGKSLFMCNEAAFNLMEGKNVVYFTMEMSEKKISERIDANLLDIDISEMKNIPFETLSRKLKKLQEKKVGRLIVKEYPTSSAHVGHFRFFLNELKTKRNFVPDVIYVDYLNICASSRMKPGVVNSYTYIKAIAEELRGLAVEFNVPLISATQVTRSGFNSSDIELTDTSESFGLPATADLMIALISTDELEEMGQIMMKQLKNRYGDLNYFRKFFVGIDRPKMRIFNVANDNEEKDDRPVFDNTDFGENSDNDLGNKLKTLRFS